MKKSLKLLAFAFVAFLFAGVMSVNAATPVKTEDELTAAIANGGNIVLEDDIKITKPIELFKDTEISSLNSYTLDGTGMTMNGKNGSILAAHAKLTLDNVNLKGAAKYGVQAYENGDVTLNDVTISNCEWGAVLVNGGQVVINDLVMDSNAWGIEFAKGENVTGDPALVMDGTMYVNNQPDAITVDDTQVDKFLIENSEASTNKIVLEDNKLLVKDNSGKTVVESKVLANDLVVSIDGQEEVTKEPVETPEEPVVTTTTAAATTTQKAIENPSTSDNLPLYIVLSLAALAGTVVFGMKIKKAMN
ncbi:MAG TPA: right-handed parallel beta-helix repeat-containing protein [Candidatus Aphodocola excrementigallinarum]|uniref:Right-handed parallel beta-helix repeat-containing protein n=1 Tax=Candidatus Aphodocola excrementigallinarum TaxID=2840670 RepID=A0A9D1IPL6_9FIRM|nr:right-handed parallel beta-helix repeat-containing protein [Candidatus Aphodocola excrementigallinarum]